MFRSRWIVLTAVLMGVLGLVACSEPTCYEQSTEYVDAAEDIIGRWEDLTLEASMTPRLGLPAVIGDMNAMIREFDALAPTECTQEFHDLMKNAMEFGMASFIMFQANDADYDPEAGLQVVNLLMDAAMQELDIIHGTPPAPSPSPTSALP